MASKGLASLTRVLEADPDLGAGIDPAAWSAAVAAGIAPLIYLERGPWRFLPPPQRGALGALIIAGIIVIRIEVGQRAHLELLTEGDVISPWVGTGENLSVPSVVSTFVLAPGQIALLDRQFALRTARWPEIQAGVIQRLVARSRRLSLQAAINSLPRIEERVESTLWALADRLGRVTREGVTMALPLTHSQLAELVGAQRPSVSVAVGRLQADGKLIREAREIWLLPQGPPEVFLSLARQVGITT